MGIILKKVSQKEKAWNIAKSRKAINRLHRLKKKKKSRNNKNSDRFVSHRDDELCLTAPPHLSLLHNPEETLAFFQNALNAMRICHSSQQIFFNLERVETISADAIMYIIAIIKNVKRIAEHKITCGGNLPKNQEACQILEQVGFYSYFASSQRPSCTKTSDNIQIFDGQNADSVLAGKVCDYVVRCCHADLRITKRIYPVILELMANTMQHAYHGDKSIMNEKWYMYVENAKDKIKFVFLDTGLGIPSTIRKNFGERVSELFLKRDSKFISSALQGAFRSETRLKNRGKGLPEVYSVAKSGSLANLTIISGKGKCHVINDGSIKELSLSSKLNGSLFYWEYYK